MSDDADNHFREWLKSPAGREAWALATGKRTTPDHGSHEAEAMRRAFKAGFHRGWMDAPGDED